MPKKTTTKSASKSSSKSAAKSTKKSTPKGRTAKSSPHTKTKAKEASEEEVTIDRRRSSRRIEEPSGKAPASLERRVKVQRRRQIDPTTCERDYSEQEVEFMNAIDEYKRKSGRMFPTCSEVLEVIRGLGYVQLTPAELADLRPEQDAPSSEAISDESINEENEYSVDAEELDLVSSAN